MVPVGRMCAPAHLISFHSRVAVDHSRVAVGHSRVQEDHSHVQDAHSRSQKPHSRSRDEAKKRPLLLSFCFSFPRVLLQIRRIRLRLF